MSAIDHRPTATEVFSTFQGRLDSDRVSQLFGHRSFKDRAMMLAVWSVATVVVFAVAWLMGAGIPAGQAFRWTLSGAVSLGIFGVGLLQQFAFWHRRRWLRWNEILTGEYRITLTDQHVDLQSERVAFRMPSVVFAAVDSGLACVRLSLDASVCRALLLPTSDCQPVRSAPQVEAFLRNRLRDGKTKSLELTFVCDRDLPVPLSHPEGTERIEFAGPLRQGDVLEVLESNRGDKLPSRIQTGIYIMMGACLAGLAVSLALVAGFKQQFPIEEWIKFGSVALVLIIVVIGALRMRSLKADVQADPEAPVSQLAIEITDSRIGVRFWQGDFQIIGRKMFRSDSEFDQAVTWVRAATSKCAV